MVDRAASKAVAVVVDREDRVVSWSGGAERLLGYDDGAVLGRPLQEVLDGRDVFGNLLCRSGCWLRQMWGRGEPVQRFEVDARHADGHRLRLVIEAEPSGSSAKDGGEAGWAYWLSPDQRHAERRRAPPPTESLPMEGRPDPTLSLTRRELEVLRLLARGAETPEIARELGISSTTARNHIQHLLEKLGAHTRLQVVSLAHRSGLL
jgi:PAS domain S-box-containing protein